MIQEEISTIILNYLPSIAFLLLMIFMTFRFRFHLFFLSLFVFVFLNIISHFVHPSYDDNFFFSNINHYKNPWEALFSPPNVFLSSKPTSSFPYLVSNIININPRNAVLTINAILISACICLLHKIFIPLKRLSLMMLVCSFCTLIICFPSVMVLFVSTNKDLYIVLSLLFLFDVFLNEKKKLFSLFTSTSFILTAGKTLSALFLLWYLRNYFLQFLLLAIFIWTEINILKKFNLRWVTNILFSFATLYIILSSIVLLKWQSLRIVIETYRGNSTIWPLFEDKIPTSIFDALSYPFVSFFTFLSYPFTMHFTNPLVSQAKVAISIYETVIFLLILVFLIKNFSITQFQKHLPLILFGIVHLSLQPWGSPNMGSLIRLRSFEAFILGFLVFTKLSSLKKNKAPQERSILAKR